MSIAPEFKVERSEFHRLKSKTIEIMQNGTIRAVRVALDEAADYARRNHPHKTQTGNLTSPENLFGEMVRADADEAWGYLQNVAPYAACVEEGTRAHLILPLNYHWGSPYKQSPESRVSGRKASPAYGAGRGQALRFVIGGTEIFRKVVHHPGTSPLPFMGPAAEFAGEVIVRETERVTFELAEALWE